MDHQTTSVVEEQKRDVGVESATSGIDHNNLLLLQKALSAGHQVVIWENGQPVSGYVGRNKVDYSQR